MQHQLQLPHLSLFEHRRRPPLRLIELKLHRERTSAGVVGNRGPRHVGKGGTDKIETVIHGCSRHINIAPDGLTLDTRSRSPL